MKMGTYLTAQSLEEGHLDAFRPTRLSKFRVLGLDVHDKRQTNQNQNE